MGRARDLPVAIQASVGRSDTPPYLGLAVDPHDGSHIGAYRAAEPILVLLGSDAEDEGRETIGQPRPALDLVDVLAEEDGRLREARRDHTSDIEPRQGVNRVAAVTTQGLNCL